MVKGLFIGTNGSCDLRNGVIYTVRVVAEYDVWRVIVYTNNHYFGESIPYKSFENMIKNWKFL